MNYFNLLLTQNLRKQSTDQGFTLLELLVVVVIVGILAATSIPSLFSQVGKARETEAVVNLGALNRAQQVYFAERGFFADSGQINKLEIALSPSSYYTFDLIGEGIQHAMGTSNINNFTKDHIGGVQFGEDTGSFSSIMCRSTNSSTNFGLVATDVIHTGVEVSSNVLSCNSTNAEEIN